MRLLCVSSGLSPCGIADHQAALAAAFDADVEVTTLRMPTDVARRSQPLKLLARRAWVRRLARRTDEFDAVLVQYHPRFWNYSGHRGEDLFGAFMARVRRPVVAIVHEAAELPLDDTHAGGVLTKLAKRAGVRFFEQLNRCADRPGAELIKAAGLIVHAPALKTWLLGLGCSEEKIHFHLHPTLAILPVQRSRAEVEARFNLQGKRFLLVLGFPDPRKGFEVALRALASLPSDVILLWAGGCRGAADAEQAERLAEIAAELGISDRWRPTGYLTEQELADVTAQADVGLAPFLSATGSSVISRMLAAGLPIVAGDLPSIRALQAGGAGLLLTAAGDPDALRDGIRQVLEMPDVALQLRRSNALFAGRHGFEKLAAEIRALIDSGGLSDRRVVRREQEQAGERHDATVA